MVGEIVDELPVHNHSVEVYVKKEYPYDLQKGLWRTYPAFGYRKECNG